MSLRGFAICLGLFWLLIGSPFGVMVLVISGGGTEVLARYAPALGLSVLVGGALVYGCRALSATVQCAGALVAVAVVLNAWAAISFFRQVNEAQPDDFFFKRPLWVAGAAWSNSLRYPFQFSPHGAMLKDCVIYNWSFRRLEFYEIGNNRAVNVMPRTWITACDIKRT